MIGAVDVGGTKVAAGLAAGGKIIARREMPTALLLRYTEAVEQIARMLRDMGCDIGERLHGIGIGLTGRVDGASRRIGRNDFLKDWEGRDLAGDLGRIFGVTVAIENDADAAALAEASYGGGRGKSRFIYLTVSTGIGGGIVLDQRLYRGAGGVHPEIGHHVIDPSGPPCFCGARGCWEQMASGTAMLRAARSSSTEARSMPELDARRICDLAEAGTGWALEVVRREGTYLGIGLANLVTLFAPDAIALGGGLMRRWEMFAPFALREVRERANLVLVENIEISRAQLEDEAPLLGAAQVWAHQFGHEPHGA